MAYSSIDDLLAEFSSEELARLTGDPTGQQINVGRIDYARLNAETVINSYLIGRYSINVPNFMDPALTKLSIDLTVANLFDYFYGRTVVPNTIVWRRMNAMNYLRDLQAGKALLTEVYDSGEFPPAIISNKENTERTFSDEILEQFNDTE